MLFIDRSGEGVQAAGPGSQRRRRRSRAELLLEARLLMGCSLRELAELTGLSLSTVRKHLRRAEAAVQAGGHGPGPGSRAKGKAKRLTPGQVQWVKRRFGADPKVQGWLEELGQG